MNFIRSTRSSLMGATVENSTEDKVIRMAWEDRTTFDEIREKTGYSEGDVIKLMRARLKPGSFRRWRRRVSGRVTKHRVPFRKTRQAASRHQRICEEEWDE